MRQRGAAAASGSGFPGILPRSRASEPFRKSACQKHFDGISQSRLAKRERVASATIERWFGRYLQLLAGERTGAGCPQILGIDEHFFTRRHGYATTFCDLKNHKVYDVVLGRSEASLESYLMHLQGKDRVQVVCMDLAPAYRALVRKHFPQATIVAEVSCNPHCEPTLSGVLEGTGSGGSQTSRLGFPDAASSPYLSLEQHERLAAYLKQWPALEAIYRLKQRLCYALVEKRRNQKRCQKLARRFLADITALRCCGLR